MFNVLEQENNDSRENHDADLALEIINCAGLGKFDGDFSAERIGTLDKQKTRPLKIKFDYKSIALDLLLQSKNFKDDEQCNSVFIVPDRNKEERMLIHEYLFYSVECFFTANAKYLEYHLFYHYSIRRFW